MTGRGAEGPTGVATPPATVAGALTGTRLPATSGCVAIGCVVVLASLTSSVNRWSPSNTPSAAAMIRAAAGGELRRVAVLSELAIEVEDPLVGHRLEQ